MESIPAEALLAAYPPSMQAIAERLRVVVRRAVPEAIERVRPGWRLIGYDVPNGRRTAYFAYVAPEVEHVHLGFEYGVLLADPHRLLLGAGVTKRVRWLTVRRAEDIDDEPFAELVHEAAAVALAAPAERLAIALDRG